MIGDVVKLALARAVEALPFGALGIRCHALPIDEDLDGCMTGLSGLLATPGYENTWCVVGSAGRTGAKPPRTVVLQSDLAAAEATRIRNDRAVVGQPKFRLIYVNSGSTPGEAGLDDVLVEVRAQALARYFAETAGLPLLTEAGQSRARPIIARLEDTTVAMLAGYADIAKSQGELVALPALGFLPHSLRADQERPTGQWVTDFDTLTSGKLIEPLMGGVRILEGLSEEERERLVTALRRIDGVLPPDITASADPVARLLKLAAVVRKYALGQEQDPKVLCGLSRRLLDILRSGERIKSLAAPPSGEEEDGDDDGDGPDDGPEGTEPPPTLVAKEEDLLDKQGIGGLTGEIGRFDIEDDSLEVELRRGPDDQVTIAPGEIHGATWQVVKEAPTLLLEGAAIEVGPEAAILAGAKPTKFKPRFRLAKQEESRPELRAAIERFLATRRTFIAAVGALLPAEPEGQFSSEQRAVLALEAMPLTCLANAKAVAEAYVEAYAAMMSQAFMVAARPPDATEKWLTHLDLVFVEDHKQSTLAARLQPLHPVRVARSLLWLEKRAEPPVFPTVLVAMTGYAPDALYPLGERYCYHARPKSGPTREGIEAAVESGLAAAWHLLAPRGLMTAIDVELVDVVNTSAAVEALYRTAAERFAADASVGAGVHLRVRCAYSEGRGPSGITCPRVEDLPELAGVAGAMPGSGVTVEVLPKPLTEGTEEVHVTVQAVEAPFLGLPPSVASGWGAKYIPGQSGNIIAVELTGNVALDGYRRLLGAYNKDTTATFDPGVDNAGLGKALVRTFVARGGWPVRPSADACLLSYNVVGPNVVATLADGAVFDSEIARKLAEFSAGGATAIGDLATLREGMLGLFPCRKFLADLLSEADPRHTLGWLGVLRAFREARSGQGSNSTLVLSLDSPEGRAWIRATSGVFGADEGRTDLLVLEADPKGQAITKIRVVELKARTSTKQLTSKAARAKLAKQALVTAAQVREVLGATEPRRMELRDHLRRLFWLGAGQQQAALLWQGTLENLDNALLSEASVAITVETECWLVPEEPWVGEEDSPEEMQAYCANGELIPDVSEQVRVRVLQAVTRREPGVETKAPAGTPPSRNSPDGAANPIDSTSDTPVDAGAERESTGPGNDKGRADARPDLVVLEGAKTASTLPEPSEVPALAKAAEPVGSYTASPSDAPPPPDGMKIVLGNLQQGQGGEAVWLPNRTDLVTHFNVGITGTMGSGKTQFTKALLAQLIRQGSGNPGGIKPGILIFDYKGDYVDQGPGGFASAVGATVLKPHKLPINPLRLKQPETTLDLKLGMRQFAETIRTIATATGDVQRLGIIQAIEGCLEDAGIDDQDPDTWSKPFPTLKDLHARLEETEEVEGVPFAVIHDLADFDIFAPKDPGVALDALFDGVTVIDLRPLAGAEKVIRAVISFFMNAMFAGMIQQGESLRESRGLPGGGTADVRQIRRLLLVDEADDFIGLNLPSLKNVMQQGRAFGYGVILSTQFLHHFDSANNPLKPLIGTWVLHRMADVAPTALRNLFGLSNDEGKVLASTLSSLEVHMSMVFGLSNKGLQRRLTRVRDLPFFELITRERDGRT